MHDPKRTFLASLRDAIPAQFGGGYRYFTGSLAYVLHRVTGIGLIIYLFLHIWSITEATSAFWKYDLLVHRYQEWDFKIGEIALYGCLLFHGLNGVRVLLVDFVLERSHLAKPLFWATALLTLALLVIGAIPLLLHWNTGPLQAAGSLTGTGS